jgi:tRNA-splicing ligase RtcB
VIRKGCTPARPGQEGFLGGSMGDESVILAGVDSGQAEESLFSTVHGAGRIMSRTQAAGRVAAPQALGVRSPGLRSRVRHRWRQLAQPCAEARRLPRASRRTPDEGVG